LLTEQDIENYSKPLQVEGWDAALWEFTRASRPSGVENRLDEMDLPILVISGDDDRIVPKEESMRLADELSNASLAIMENCGHVPQEECPQAFWKAVGPFISQFQILERE
jgi:pimeloyl-ACP methyl ester carboxylesterase